MQTSLDKEPLFARWIGFFWYSVSCKIDDILQKNHDTIIRTSWYEWMNERKEKSDTLVRQRYLIFLLLDIMHSVTP